MSSFHPDPLSPQADPVASLEAELASVEAELAAVRADNARLSRSVGANTAPASPAGSPAREEPPRDANLPVPYRGPDRQLTLERALSEARTALAHERIERSILASQHEARRSLAARSRGSWVALSVVSGVALVSLVAALIEGNLGFFLVPTLICVLFTGIVRSIRQIPPSDVPPGPPPTLAG